MPPSLSITALVPVYNEIATVGETIPRVHDFLGSLGRPFELLIIESGSSDGTAQACDALAQRLLGTVVVHEGARNGFGAALRLGFAEATSDLLWVVPVDLPYSFAALTEALTQIPSCDAILSVRRSDDRNLFRRLQSRVYTWLCWLLLQQPAISPNAAFKLYRRQIIQSLPLHSTGWFIDTEIAYRLRERHSRIGLIAIDVIERTTGRSTVTAMDSWRVLKQLLRFRQLLTEEKQRGANRVGCANP